MSNYKALGIEKEMNEEYSFWNGSDLKKLIDSEYFYLPYISKREPSEYCEITVADCQGENWWYKNLIGFNFFCKIIYMRYADNKRFVTEFRGVKLTNTKEIIFRGFDPKDVVMR